ncbi:putative EDS1, EP domain-containing protein [Helianthus anomalus]
MSSNYIFQEKVNPITTQKPNKIPKIFNKSTPVKTIDHDQLVNGKQAEEFFEHVLINASTVASHDTFDLMEPTNSLKDKLSAGFVKVSPYRPFGVYVFCTQGEDLAPSTSRQQLVVENPNAVLQLLFYFLQLPNEDQQDLAQFALQSLTENFGYEKELNKNGLQLEKIVDIKQLLTSNGATDDLVPTSNKALLDLSASAKWCLLAVEEAEKRKEKNKNEIKKSMREYISNEREPTTKIIEDMLDEIVVYGKKHSGGNIDHYEAFKLQKDHDDFKANVNRLEQAKIWDVIVEMPLDIANYYRHSKGEDTGSRYMEGRPKRYKFTQRWYEHANVTAFELVSESNFVAEVEELMKPKKKSEEVNEGFKNIITKVEKWKSDEKIAYEDVFWGESVLSKLQEKLA